MQDTTLAGARPRAGRREWVGLAVLALPALLVSIELLLAIGVWLVCFMGGAAIGPVVGGLMLENFWWGSVFLLGVPAMVLLLVLGPVLLPEYRNTQAGRLDPTSVALSLAAILPVIYGLKELARGGWQRLAAAARRGRRSQAPRR